MDEEKSEPAWRAWINPAFPFLRFIAQEAPAHWSETDDPIGVPGWLPAEWRDRRCFPFVGTVEAIREWFDHQIESFERAERSVPSLTSHRHYDPEVTRWWDDTMHDALLLVDYLVNVAGMNASLDDAERLTKRQRPLVVLRALRDRLFRSNAPRQEPPATGAAEQEACAGFLPLVCLPGCQTESQLRVELLSLLSGDAPPPPSQHESMIDDAVLATNADLTLSQWHAIKSKHDQSATELREAYLRRTVQQWRPKVAQPDDKPAPEASEQGEGDGKSRDEILQSLPLCVKQAYFTFELAQTMMRQKLEDQEAYDYVHANGLPEKGDLGELTDYKLPDPGTWTRYLRTARNALGEQKYKRKGRPPLGGSIVGTDQVERRKGDK